MGGTDSAYIVRNTARGKKILDEMINLQLDMENCPAPGMAMIWTYVLHLINGTFLHGRRMLYHGECEKQCTRPYNPFDYDWYADCITHVLEAFQISPMWQTVQVHIPGGFWAQPAQTDMAYMYKKIPIADDIGKFSPGSANTWDKTKSADSMINSNDFVIRYNTTLALHIGGGPFLNATGDTARMIRDSFAPWHSLREINWTISSVGGVNTHASWGFVIHRLERSPHSRRHHRVG